MVTTNFPSGLTNAQVDTCLGTYTSHDLTKNHEFWTDFDTVSVGTSATDWLATNVGSTPTYVASSVDNGALLITNTAGASDSCFLQYLGKASAVLETFSFVVGYQTWFKIRFKTNDATNSIIVAGLQITDTTPAAVSDGVFFIKPTGAATVNFVVEASNVATTVTNIGSLADNTYATLGFWFNGIDRIAYFLNDVNVGSAAITNMPGHTLTMSFGIQNGASAAKTLTVDYIFAARERS